MNAFSSPHMSARLLRSLSVARLRGYAAVFVLVSLFILPTLLAGAENSVNEGVLNQERVPPRRLVRIGFFPFEGFHILDDDSLRSGYGYDYVQNLRNFAAWTFDYSPPQCEWPQMLEMLEAGQIDLVTSVRKTPEREEKFAFSEYPMGYSSTILTVKSGNDHFLPGQYHAWNGIRVGVLKNSSQALHFEKFAAQKGIQWQAFYYDSHTQLMHDLIEADSIDAAVSSDLRVLKEEWVLEQFDTNPFYIAVRKSDTALLNELNYAQGCLRAAKPDLPEALRRRYYSLTLSKKVPFTADEKAFIEHMRQTKQEFVGVINPDREPLSYLKDGEYAGVFKEVAQEVILRTGLNIRFLPVVTREEYVRACASPEVDFVFDMRAELAPAEKLNLCITTPYYLSRAVLLHRKGVQHKFRSFATVGYSNMPKPIIALFDKEVRIVSYNSLHDAMEAVRTGECEATFQHAKSAEMMLLNDVTGQLSIQYLESLNVGYAIGVRDTLNPMIYSIVEKALASLGPDYVNSLDMQYDVQIISQDFLQRAIYQHPWPFVLTLLAVLILFVCFLVVIISRHRRERRHYREKEQLLADSQVLNNCLSAFLRSQDLSSALGPVLQVLGQRFGANRAYVLGFDPETKRETLLGEYADKNHDQLADYDVKAYYDTRDVWYQRLHAKEEIWLDNLDVPEQLNTFAQWKSTICRDHLTAIYVRGIWLDEQLRGNIGLSFCKGTPVPKFTRAERDIVGAVVHFVELMMMRQNRQLELIAAMERAKAADKAKSLFLASMSHEIRTPLNAVIGFAELLKDDTVPENVRNDYLDGIGNAGNALLSLINDVLDLTKLEANGVVFTPVKTRFSQLLHETLTVFQQKCDAKRVALRCEIDDDFPLVSIDKLRVRQILFNLIGNAAKFTDNGAITLRAAFTPDSDKKGTLVFHVIDTGIGISPENQKRLFQPFIQVDTLSAPHLTGGTGLGLALCRRLVEKMNGKIELTSQEQKGSDFFVTLRHVPYEKATSAPKEQTKPLLHTDVLMDKNLKILLVDDVALNLKVASAMLNKIGVHVVTAVDAITAWDALEKEHFDFLLTDLWMPGMNGAELASKVRNSGRFKHMGIAVITADTDVAGNFDANIFDAVLTKPITSSDFRNFILRFRAA